MPRKDKDPSPESELSDIREYISQLESRCTWSENEINKISAARSIRLARMLSAIRQKPLSIGTWIGLPGSLFRSLKPLKPEIKSIQRKRFKLLKLSTSGAISRSGTVRSIAPKTVMEGLYQNTALGLDRHERIAGLANPGVIKRLNQSAALFPVRPDNYDHVMQSSEATAFVLDLDYAEEQHLLWKGILSMENIPISQIAAECLKTARARGMTLILFTPDRPHRYPFLGDVKSLFHLEF